MKRKIVTIDEAKCNGCGLCATACAEGAIAIIDGKARLVSETYCDGLGACLGECPQDAIKIIEREASDFDAAAAEKHVEALKAKQAARHAPHAPHAHAGHVCPGSALRSMNRAPEAQGATGATGEAGSARSALSNWPVQLMLVPPTAPYLKGADILISADCVPFALADFHQRYLAGRAVLVGCPKLDDVQYYAEKLREVFTVARPASVTVVRMQVPCCGGIVQAVLGARDAVAPDLAITVDTIAIEGGVLRRETL